jgi:hypothetical protein
LLWTQCEASVIPAAGAAGAHAGSTVREPTHTDWNNPETSRCDRLSRNSLMNSWIQVTKPCHENTSRNSLLHRVLVQQLAEHRSLLATRLYHTLTLSQSYAPCSLFPGGSRTKASSRSAPQLVEYLLRSKWPPCSDGRRPQQQNLRAYTLAKQAGYGWTGSLGDYARSREPHLLKNPSRRYAHGFVSVTTARCIASERPMMSPMRATGLTS